MSNFIISAVACIFFFINNCGVSLHCYTDIFAREIIEKLLYADDDLLVSGVVVLTSRTSVPTFTFIHFSHFGLRIFGDFGLSSSAFVELIVPVFSTKRIFPGDTPSRSDPCNKLGRTFRSIFFGSFLPYIMVFLHQV